jgi:hypothetical protein
MSSIYLAHAGLYLFGLIPGITMFKTRYYLDTQLTLHAVSCIYGYVVRCWYTLFS